MRFAAALWAARTGGKVDATARFAPDGRGVYVGSYDGYLYARRGERRADLRVARGAGAAVRSSATASAAGARVFVGSSDGYLYAFDAASGALAWRAFCGESDPLYGVRADAGALGRRGARLRRLGRHRARAAAYPRRPGRPSS